MASLECVDREPVLDALSRDVHDAVHPPKACGIVFVLEEDSNLRLVLSNCIL